MAKKRGFLDGYKTYDTTTGYGNPEEWFKAFRERMTGEEAEKILAAQPDTPQAILGVSMNATTKEIKKAYRLLVMEWHPDRNQHRQEQAKEMSQKIIAAYTKLVK